MKYKLGSIIMSHLSDLQIEMDIPSMKGQAKTRVAFIKWLILTHTDLSKEINPNEEWIKYEQHLYK